MKTEDTPMLLATTPDGLIDRIKAAEQRIDDGHAPRRIPADPTDVDLVLAEVRLFLEGKAPPFWVPAQHTTAPDLQGLRDALLTPREIIRDSCGMLDHPSFPVFDEDVSARLFVKAFGLEAAFALMEDDVDLDTMEAYDGDCTAWTPTPPAGEGWLLTLIYDTEEGPCAMFVRTLKIAPSRRRRAWQDAAGRSEWDAAQTICDHKDVDEALRTLAEDPTGDNATRAVRSVLRLVAMERAYQVAAAVDVLHEVADWEHRGESVQHRYDEIHGEHSYRRALDAATAMVAQPGLHPATVNLVRRFSQALAEKLAAAEKKHGYSDGWAQTDWMDECRAKLLGHVAKGDPRDVAAYCAFLWHHGASTNVLQPISPKNLLPCDGDYLRWARREGASVAWNGEGAGVHFTTTSWANFCNRLRSLHSNRCDSAEAKEGGAA